MTRLLLAGTSQAQRIAAAWVEGGVQAVASLSGATRTPRDLGLPTRIGGFGGDAGFRTYLEDRKISAVLDATHPFANQITQRTARICLEMGVPYCQLLRPGWVPEAGDDWHFVDDESQVAALVDPGATVFLATGRQTLLRFENLAHCRLICRQIDPPDGPFPFPNGEFLLGRPPFSIEEECALFSRLNIDWLVVKNAGGAASRSKLDAARQLGIRVAMINRPAQPEGICRVETVEDALKWEAAL